MILKIIGGMLVFASCLFDLFSYWKQIAKTLRTKKSGQVSSQAYMMKISHYLCSLIALAIYTNWVGFGMEFSAFVICLIAFSIVIKYKPRGWKLFHFSK